MENNKEFIELYNELDNLIDQKYHREEDDSSIYFLINKYKRSNLKREIEYANKLDSIRKIRNLYIHEQGVLGELFIVNDEVILTLKEIIKYLKNPLIAKEIMTPIHKIKYAKEDDSIYLKAKEIVEGGFSNIPILDREKRVIGVFNSDVLLSIFIKDINIGINDNLGKIKEYTKLENQKNLRFIFVDDDFEIDVLNEYFINSKENYNKRLPIIFVSEKGRSDSPLLGLISPIDLIKANKNKIK